MYSLMKLYPKAIQWSYNWGQKVSEYDQEIQQSHTAEQPRGSARKSHTTFIVTIHMLDNNSKATSFLFLFKMIAKLKWTQSNA